MINLLVPHIANRGIERLVDGISLNTQVLEEDLKPVNGGVNLSRVKTRRLRRDNFYLNFVPHFGADEKTEEEILKIIDKFPEIDSPCSMEVKNLDELSRHMLNAYVISHFHYILGKKENLKGSFPELCCGIWGISVALSLIEFGYPNATYVYSNKHDHAYSLLPFVLGMEGLEGSIVIDPTSDQLYNGRIRPRNAVFIKMGDKWEYKTDWANGADLFPDRFCSMNILRMTPKDILRHQAYYRNSQEFFMTAFSNPVLVRQ